MKTAKTLMMITAVAGLVAFSTVAHAQSSTGDSAKATPPPASNGRGVLAEAQMARVDEAVRLTGEQKTSVKAAFEGEGKAVEALKAQDLTWEQRRAGAKAIHEQTSRKLKEILTAEQYSKYEAKLQQRAP